MVLQLCTKQRMLLSILLCEMSKGFVQKDLGRDDCPIMLTTIWRREVYY